MDLLSDRRCPYNLLVIYRYLRQLPGFEEVAESVLDTARDDHQITQILPRNVDLSGRTVENSFLRFAADNPLVTLERCFLNQLPSGLTNRTPLSVRSARGGGHRLKVRSTAAGNIRYLTPKFEKANDLLKIRCRRQNGRLPRKVEYNDTLWSTFQTQLHILGHLDQVNIITFDQTGKRILTGSDESLIKIWSSITGMLLMTLRGHEGEIMDMQVHPDNTLLASCDDKKSIRVWCLQSGATVTCLLGQHCGHKITTISWGPGVLKVGDSYIRPLLSTGNDGSVVFWSYDESEKTFIQEPPPKFTERTKPGDKAVQQSWSKGGRLVAVGFSDGRIRVYMLLKPDSPHGVDRIAELDAHTGCISSLEFCQIQSSKIPPKLLSTSFDGSAIIWRMEKGNWKIQTIECVLESEITDPKKKPKVNDGIWMKYDELITVAIVGETKQNVIKVFNVASSSLVTTLSHHTEAIQNLKIHPKDPNIFASSGCDGLLIVWDVSGSRKLAEVYFPTTVESGESMSLHDISWSPDGTKIVAADSQGHMSIIGFGYDLKLAALPNELFFETDYHPIVRDREGFVVDEQTGLAPHLQHPGMYTNSQNEPHLGSLNVARAREQVVEASQPSQRDLLGERIRQMELERTQSQLNESEEGLPMMLDENSVHLDMSVLTFEVQMRSQWGQKNSYRSSFINPLPKKTIRERNKRIKELNFGEEKWYKKEGPRDSQSALMEIDSQTWVRDAIKSTKNRNRRDRRRDPELPEPELPPLSDEDQSIQGSDEEYNLTHSSEDRARQGQRRRLPRGYVPPEEDDQDDESGADELDDLETDSKERESSHNTSSDFNPSYTQAVPSSSRSRNRRRALPKTQDPDESEEEKLEMMSSFSDPDQETPGPSSKRPRRRRILSSEDEDFMEEASIDPLVRLKKRKSGSRHSSLEAPKVNQCHLQWISQTQPLRCPFIPQIGDRVWYIPRAHEQFVKELEKQNISLRKGHRIPYEVKTRLDLMDKDLECKVIEIEIELMKEKMFNPPARWCALTLSLIENDLDVEHIKVKYAPLENCEEFLIFGPLYEKSRDAKFQVGDEVWGVFEEIGPDTRIPQWFAGQVTQQNPCKGNQGTEYNKFDVKWHADDKIDLQSSWNLVERLSDEQPEVILSEIMIDEHETLRMINVIHNLIIQHIPDVDIFNYEIEKQYRAEYDRKVPYKTNLTQIKDRLETKFYRSKQSLIWEIEHLHKNCVTFNGPDDAISNGMFSVSRILVSVLIEAVNNRRMDQEQFIAKLMGDLADQFEESGTTEEDHDEDGEDENEVDDDEVDHLSASGTSYADESEEEETPVRPRRGGLPRVTKNQIIADFQADEDQSFEFLPKENRIRKNSDSIPLSSADECSLMPLDELRQYIEAVGSSKRVQDRLLSQLQNLPVEKVKAKLREINPELSFELPRSSRSRKIKRYHYTSSEGSGDGFDEDYEKENRPKPKRTRVRPPEPSDDDEDQNEEDEEDEDDDDTNKIKDRLSEGDFFDETARDGHSSRRRSNRRRPSYPNEDSNSSNSRSSRKTRVKSRVMYKFQDTSEDSE